MEKDCSIEAISIPYESINTQIINALIRFRIRAE
jgi:hypothetical protein